MALTSYMESFLKELIAIPSSGGTPSEGAPYGKEPRRALDFFLDSAKAAGFKTGVTGGRAGWVEFGKGDRLIGIICHLDVVPAGDGWETDPFTLTFKEDPDIGVVMYGRGIVDDKGPAAASFFAMKELLDEGRIPEDFRVRLILGTDEERTCSCVEYYADHEQIPDFAITPDAEFPAIYCEKGILHINFKGKNTGGLWAQGGSAPNMVPAKARAVIDGLDITATGKPAHASKPELGINAIEKLVDTLIENNIPADNYPILKFIRDFDAAAFTGCCIKDESGALSSNIGLLKAEADECSVVIDFRVPYSVDLDAVIGSLREKAAEYGLTVQIDERMDSIYMNKDSSDIKKLTRIWEEHMDRFTGFKEEYREKYTEAIAVGGGTYARHIPNTVAFGVQAPWHTDQCHQANESAAVSDFLQWVQIIKKVILEQ